MPMTQATVYWTLNTPLAAINEARRDFHAQQSGEKIMKYVRVLAIFLSLLFTAGAADQNGDYVLQNGTKCGLPGTAKSDTGKDLNRHKNRFAAPTDDQIDL